MVSKILLVIHDLKSNLKLLAAISFNVSHYINMCYGVSNPSADSEPAGSRAPHGRESGRRLSRTRLLAKNQVCSASGRPGACRQVTESGKARTGSRFAFYIWRCHAFQLSIELLFHLLAPGQMSQHNWTAGLTSFVLMLMCSCWWPTLNPLSWTR